MKIKFKLATSIVVLILICESVFTGLIPHAKGYLFEQLTNKSSLIYMGLGLYFLNYLMLDFCQAIKNYFITRLSMLYRSARTRKTVKSLVSGVSNTAQRLQEDIKISYMARITVYSEYFISFVIVIQLLIINLSQPLLILSALIYAGISVLIAFKFNPRLTKAHKTVQEKEATYRYSLLDSLSLSELMTANRACMMEAKIKMHYLLFTKLQLAVMIVLPYIMLVPSLLDGSMTLGVLVKHQATFSLIVVNAAILIQYYTLLVQGRASEDRVRDLEKKKDD